MKKAILILAAALPTTVCVQAAETGGMHMEGMKTEQAPSKAVVHRTKGIVKSIEAAKGTLTLAHEPVPALKWPAMTMPFKITPELSKGVQVGQQVEIEFESQGMSATITRIAVAKK